MIIEGEFLYGVDQWVLLAILLALLIATEELGYRIGRRRRAEYDDDGRSNFGKLQTSLFGLLGLLLAFTFAMAQQRFETRKESVVLDANAIGTAWLRTGFLPSPADEEVRRLFIRYVELGNRPDSLSVGDRRQWLADIDQLRSDIWSRVAAAASANPQSIPLSLLVAATNDMIDMHGKRVAAARHHVPETLLLLLAVFALSAAGVTGYRCGIGPRRYRVPSTALLVLIAVVIGVILDLDRPRRGLIAVDQSAMRDLHASIQPQL